MPQLSAEARNLNWLLANFANRTPGVAHVMAISDGSCLTVLAASACDVGVVGYEMALLVTRAGEVLTPGLRAELQAALPA
jgi:predicted regulator of Ras-like GTPase activity (Roadblock/LC7/MglB family)